MWLVSFTHPEKGYSVKRSTGTRNRKEAEQKRFAIECDIIGTHTGLKPSNANYTVGELLNAYKASKEEIADTDERALKKLTEYFGKFKPEQLGDGAWKQYRKWRTSQNHSNAASKFYKKPKKVGDSSVNRELNVLRAAIRWAQGSTHWPGLQHVRVSTKGGSGGNNARVEFLEKEDAERLLTACVEPHHKLFVLLALATGARHRAILDLRWDRVTWPTGSATPNENSDFAVENYRDHPETSYTDLQTGEQFFTGGPEFDEGSSELSGGILLDLGADVGNKRKPVAWIDRTQVKLYSALLAAYKTRTTPYVIEYKKGGIGRKVDRVDLADAYRRAGLKKPEAPQHILKHTCISWLMQAGVEIARIANLTRTSIPTIEKTYGHLSPKHLETINGVLTL